MKVFNATNLLLEFQDRIVRPGMMRDFPGVEDRHLTGTEKLALEKGIFTLTSVPLRELHLSFRTDLPVKLADVLKAV